MAFEDYKETTREGLEKALIFMIDAYADSGLIDKEELIIMLQDIVAYYRRAPSISPTQE